MKTLNTNTAKIRDKNNNWSSLPSLRGESAYELAVKKGFEGSEDDFNNSLVKKEEIDKINETLKKEIAAKVGYSEVVGNQLLMYADDTKEKLLATLELPSGGSNLDIQINGQSIVKDGIAEIPVGQWDKYSLFKIGSGMSVTDGRIHLLPADDNRLSNREWYSPITAGILDKSVKAAMCDGKGAVWTSDEQSNARERIGAWTGDWQIIMDETLAEIAKEVSFKVPDDTKEMICFFKSGATVANAAVYLKTKNSGASVDESFASFGGSLSTSAISIGCQKIQFLSSQYGLIEYSYLSHSIPSSSDYAQRVGKASVLRIDDKRFFFNSVNQDTGYPVGTRLLVFVRR